uniref:Transposase n=1 Tax=Globodera pallida TaxID=36090 RepID=A0A183C0B9_GLOPA
MFQQILPAMQGNSFFDICSSARSYCQQVYHDNKSGCFIRKLRVPAEKQRYRIVCWDTETRLQPLAEGQQMHKVNYLSARVTCTECADSLHQGAKQMAQSQLKLL